MKTKISFPFLLSDITQSFVSAIITASGLQNITILSIEAKSNTITVDASRYLTADEKTAVKTAIIASITIIEDL